jgi:hypothetical protein
MVEVNRSPFSPLMHSSLLESRKGLQFLAHKWIGFVTPVILHRFFNLQDPLFEPVEPG